MSEERFVRGRLGTQVTCRNDEAVLYLAIPIERVVIWIEKEDGEKEGVTGIHGNMFSYRYQTGSPVWEGKEHGSFGMYADVSFDLGPSPLVIGSGYVVLEESNYGIDLVYTLRCKDTWGVIRVGDRLIALSHIPGAIHSPRYDKIQQRGGYALEELQFRGAMSAVSGGALTENSWAVVADSGHVLLISRPGEDDWGERGPDGALEAEAFGRIKLMGDLAPEPFRDVVNWYGVERTRRLWCVGTGEIMDSSATVLCLQEEEEGSREVAILDVHFGDQVLSDVVLTEGVDESLERFHVIVEQEPDASVLEWFCMETAESINVLHLGKYVKEAGISWTQVSFPADSDPLTGYRGKDGGLHMFALTAKGELVELTLESHR